MAEAISLYTSTHRCSGRNRSVVDCVSLASRIGSQRGGGGWENCGRGCGNPDGGSSGGERNYWEWGAVTTCLNGLVSWASHLRFLQSAMTDCTHGSCTEKQDRDTGRRCVWLLVCYFSRTPDCPGFMSDQSLRPLHRKKKALVFLLSTAPTPLLAPHSPRSPRLQAKDGYEKRKCFSWGQDV